MKSVTEILRCRGYNNEDIAALLIPVPIFNPRVMYMEEAYSMLIGSIFSDESIMVLYDTDVDGLQSGYLEYSFIKSIGGRVTPYINTVKTHGITENIYEFIMVEKIDLLVAVDSSTNDVEMIAKLNKHGVKVLVLDHHLIESYVDVTPTPLKVICNVKNLEPEETRDFAHISGAMLCYYFNRYCKKRTNGQTVRQIYEGDDLDDFETALIDNFDLAALTIISDFCPLNNSVNRSILNLLFKRKVYSSKIAMFVYGVDMQKLPSVVQLVVADLAFSLIPAYNALIRTGKSDVALKMVNTLDNDTYRACISESKKAIELQKSLVETLMSDCAVYTVGKFSIVNMSKSKLGEYEGLKSNFSGLLASNIRSIFKTPTLALYNTLVDPNVLKGSFRGFSHIKYKNMLESSGCIARGHEVACGVELKCADLGAFSDIFNSALPEIISEVLYDLEETPISVRLSFKEMLEYAEFNEYAGVGIEKIRIKFKSKVKLSTTRYSSRFMLIECDGVKVVTFCSASEFARLKVTAENFVVTPTLKIQDGVKSYVLIYET